MSTRLTKIQFTDKINCKQGLQSWDGRSAMFSIGDVIIYSVHGLSQIDDICEKTVSNVTKTYYVLHPLEQSNLTISTPIDNDKVVMLKMMNREEAKELLDSFKQPGLSWIDDSKQRTAKYKDMIKVGNRKNIARIVTTLMKKNHELKLKDRKLYDQDRKMLTTIQNILFKEMAVALDTSFDNIFEQVDKMVKKQLVKKQYKAC